MATLDVVKPEDLYVRRAVASFWRDRFRWLLLFGIAVVVLYPIGTLIYSSFLATEPGGGSFRAKSMSLEPWRDAFGDGYVLDSLLTTFRVVIPKVAFAVGLATFFAWTIGRTNTPGRSKFEAAIFFMWFTPTLPVILSWIVLLAPRAGLLNKWMEPILPFGFRFNAYSYESLVFFGGIYVAPILFIFLLPAFRNMDASLEESAQMSGATLWHRARHITIPLMLPAILTVTALVIVLSLESFELEALLGIPAGIFVFTTRIFDLLFLQNFAEFGTASALALVLMMITLTLIIFQRRILAKREFTTITGKGYRPKQMDLGKWRWVTFSILLGYVLIFGLFPIVMLIVNSFMVVSGFIGPAYFTMDNWIRALTEPNLLRALRNTLVLGFSTATIGVVLVSVSSYVVIKTKDRWRGVAALDMVMWLPIAVPGMVLALGMLWAYVRLPIYNTLWILVLAFLIRGLPTGSRFFTTTMIQVGNELEESARIHGASWLRTLRSILLPLLKPAVISAWIFLFVLSTRQLDSALLLSGPQTQVLSVTMFKAATRGSFEVASALGLMQTILVFSIYLGLRFIGGRDRAQG
jgi:iron(III) transport system permease protein